jgi:uncharacterized repeat protein (TIGR04138 family)
MSPHQALERIRAELIDSGRDTRYALGGYNFVLHGLEFYLMKIGEKRHVSGQEFSRGLAEFAAKQFGPLAGDVLRHWGIRGTDDFGNIVYNLIDVGLMVKQEGDSVADFHSVFDLGEYFRECDPFQIDREHIREIRGA